MDENDRQLAGRAIVAKVFVEERWASIPPSAPGYEASNLGRVRGLDRVVMRGNGVPQTVHGRVLTYALDTQGRPIANIHVGGKGRTRRACQLVLEAFVGPCPKGMECCHADDNRLNNRLENLRWDTHAENTRDRARNGIHYLSNRELCPRRHRLAEPNLVRSALPHRNCLACCRAAVSVNYHRRRNGVHLDMAALADQHYARITEAAA